MTNRTPDENESGVLLRVLTAHFKALVSARSDEIVLRQYSALLRFLKSSDCKFLEGSASMKTSVSHARPLPTHSDEELRSASLDDVEKLVSDEANSRKDLERIAIYRFGVPRGSMRRFSNRQMLVDKLRTLIANERTHETIGAVARGQAKHSSNS